MKHKLLILADSYGRHCSRILSDKIGQHYEVTSVTKPNARLAGVVEDIYGLSKKLTKQDCVIVLAGCNDFNNVTSDSASPNIYLSKLTDAVKYTNVIFRGIPLIFNKLDSNYYFLMQILKNKYINSRRFKY